MDIGTTLVAISGSLAMFGAPVAITYIWFHRPAALKEIGSRPMDTAIEGRLERIEVAVQAIAIETERIAEAQRFTTRLLTAAPDRTPSGI